MASSRKLTMSLLWKQVRAYRWNRCLTLRNWWDFQTFDTQSAWLGNRASLSWTKVHCRDGRWRRQLKKFNLKLCVQNLYFFLHNIFHNLKLLILHQDALWQRLPDPETASKRQSIAGKVRKDLKNKNRTHRCLWTDFWLLWERESVRI